MGSSKTSEKQTKEYIFQVHEDEVFLHLSSYDKEQDKSFFMQKKIMVKNKDTQWIFLDGTDKQKVLVTSVEVMLKHLRSTIESFFDRGSITYGDDVKMYVIACGSHDKSDNLISWDPSVQLNTKSILRGMMDKYKSKEGDHGFIAQMFGTNQIQGGRHRKKSYK